MKGFIWCQRGGKAMWKALEVCAVCKRKCKAYKLDNKREMRNNGNVQKLGPEPR